MGMPNKSKVITASEIAQYSYCPLAWQMQRKGIEPDSPELEKGAENHERLGAKINEVEAVESRAGTLACIGILLGLVAVAVFAFFVVWGML